MQDQGQQGFKFLLGSSSPRRREILSKMGYKFEVLKPGFEEKPIPSLSPEEYVEFNANEKAKWISENQIDQSSQALLILAADTIVVYQNQILEKPKNPRHSEQMLEMLSGKIHTVMTGYSLYFRKARLSHWVTDSCVIKTRVTFNSISNSEIAEYVKTGEPKDKAGSYGIQGMGKFLVKEIEGSLSNVIGLPDEEVRRAIARITSA